MILEMPWSSFSMGAARLAGNFESDCNMETSKPPECRSNHGNG
jgi:hypothetical protein